MINLCTQESLRAREEISESIRIYGEKKPQLIVQGVQHVSSISCRIQK